MARQQEIVEFKIEKKRKFYVIHFELKKEISPADLKRITPPDAVENKFSSKGVILSGRAPIWFYGFLIHFYHPTKFIAVYEPRLNKAVVVETHTSKYKVGDLIKI